MLGFLVLGLHKNKNCGGLQLYYKKNSPKVFYKTPLFGDFLPFLKSCVWI